MNNYHTHTYRCHHAQGDVADYVAEAARAGLGELGFSEHCPYPDGRWGTTHMRMDAFPGYLEAIAAAKAASAADSALPRIFAGLECEWIPERESTLREEFLGSRGLDYLAAGIHYYWHQGEWRDSFRISEPAELVSFAATTCGAMESGIFAFLAHPDVFMYHWMPWDGNARACAADILSTAERTGCPLEINGYGLRKKKVDAPSGPRPPYPHEEFWRMASDYDIRCVVNSDAHRPVDTAACLTEGRTIAARHGLTVLDRISI